MHASLPTPTPRVLPILAVPAALSACVSLHQANVDYVEVRVPYATKVEVLSVFGEPRRRGSDQGVETWHYRFHDQGLTGKALHAASSGGGVLTPRSYTTTTYDENVRFSFEGDALKAAYELVESSTGFHCGIFLTHGVQPRCGAYSAERQQLVRSALPRPVTERTNQRYPSMGCSVRSTTTATDAVCLAYQSLDGDWARIPLADWSVLDLGTNYVVTFHRVALPSEATTRSFRVVAETRAVQPLPGAVQP